MTDRPLHPNGWPELQPAARLPGLSLDDAESVQERLERLALAYGTIAATYHQQWPLVVQALEWLKARLETGDGPRDVVARERMASAHELEEAAERLERAADDFEDVVTGSKITPLKPFDSERVRAIAAEEIQRSHEKEAAARLAEMQAEQKAEAALVTTRKWQFAFAILGAALAVVGSLLVWALTHK